MYLQGLVTSCVPTLIFYRTENFHEQLSAYWRSTKKRLQVHSAIYKGQLETAMEIDGISCCL